MAEPTPTSGVAPLSEAELAQLNELAARKAAADAAAADQTRKDRLAALAPMDKLVKLVVTDKVNTAVSDILADPNVDFDTKQKVQNFKASVDYNIGTVATMMSDLSKPAPPPLV